MKHTDIQHPSTLVRLFNHARFLRLVLILALLVASMPLLPVRPAYAVNVDVTSFADPTESGKYTLRDAINLSNGSGVVPSEIELNVIDYPVLLGKTIALSQDIGYGELLISKGVNILGPGADKLTISGQDTSRVFHITGGANVTISGLTITGGRSPDPGKGGGIFIEGASTVTIDSCVINGNVSTSNTAGDGGAGIAVTGGSTLIIKNSTIYGNVTDNATAGVLGGGILNDGSTVSLINTTVSGNRGGIAGGGIANVNTGKLDIKYSTIAYNKVKSNIAAYTDGPGGIYNTNPTASDVTVQASIIAQNGVGINNDATIAQPADCQGLFMSNGDNLVEALSYGSVTCGWTSGTGDKLGVAVNLHPLSVNRGPGPATSIDNTTTLTHMPKQGSPAIDAISNGSICSTSNGTYNKDQRGRTRPFVTSGISDARNNCDIGAHEVYKPIVTGTGDSGAGTLRQAIADVDTGATVTFDTALYGQTVETNVYGSLVITRSMDIQGPGANLLTVRNTKDVSYGDVSVFTIQTPAAHVNISGINISNIARFDNNDPVMAIDQATAALDSCTLQLYTYVYPDLSYTEYENGGISVTDHGTLTLSNTLVSKSHRYGVVGGAMTVDNSTLIMTRTTIADNVSEAAGGAIAVINGGSATINESTISGNTAPKGGGIASMGIASTVTINSSTVSGNTTPSSGTGAGIYTEGALTIKYSTIANNSGPTDANTAVSIDNAGTTPIIALASIIAKNNPAHTKPDCRGSFTSHGYNLVETLDSGCTWATTTGDQLNVAAQLQALADNGGLTKTHIPRVGSPVLDAIPDGTYVCGTAPFQTDQRGKSRPSPANGACDIGAVEVVSISPVTSPADSGTGSLRQALADATSGATITFDPSMNGQTITLASQLDITKDVTIQGPGATNLTISGNNASRVLNIGTGASLWLNGVTVTQGKVSGANSGAGILNQGTLTLVDSTVTNNAIDSVTAGYGGAGIASVGSATLTITRSTVSNNTIAGTGGVGGGIANLGGSKLEMTLSTIATNSVAGNGGGIANIGSTATVMNTTIRDNSASVDGGGIASNGTGATVTMMNSTLNGNSATATGGGFANGANSTATLGNSTISSNSASTGGGFSHDAAGTDLTMNFTTIVSNTASTSGGGIANAHTTKNVVVKNSILSTNSNPSSPDCSGKVELYQFGLIGSTTGCTIVENKPSYQPSFIMKNYYPARLGILANIGGPTWTHSPLSNSSAINAIESNVGTSWTYDCYSGPPYNTDQRGMPRPAVVGGACDIGAVEFHNRQPVPIATSATLASVAPNSTNPPGETVANLFSALYTDEDDNPFAGVAVTFDSNFNYANTPSPEGLWHYSTDGGQTWQSIDTDGGYYWLVMRPTDKLRFVPKTGYEGTPTNVLLLVLWDGTTQAPGNTQSSTKRTTVADGTFSSFSKRITLSTRVGINYPPTSKDSSITTAEDATYLFKNADFPFTDQNPTDTIARVKMVSMPAGTLTCGSSGGPFIVGSECIPYAMTYTPPADAYGSPLTTFRFKVVDSGGESSTNDYVMSINVTPVNDPPTISTNTGAFPFRGTVITISANQLSATDVDDSASTLTYVVDQLPAYGVLSNGTTALAVGSTFTQQDIDTGQLNYQHDNSATNADSFTFKVRDASGTETTLQTFSFVIAKIDPELRLMSFTKSITEDTALGFAPLDFTTNVSHTSGLTIETVLMAGLPSHGKVLVGSSDAYMWQIIPITNVTTLVYTPTKDYNGPDTFSWNVGTVNGYAATTATITLAITPTNDPPVLAYVSKTGAENTPVAFKRHDFINAFTDIDSPALVSVKIVSLPLHGRLLLGNTPVSEQQVIVAADLDTLVFIPDTNWSGATSFLWNASDGIIYSNTNERVSILISSHQNDAPILSDLHKQGMEDTSLVIVTSDFNTPPTFIELDEDDPQEWLKIVSLPQHGTLLAGTTPVQVGQELRSATLTSLTFVPEPNWNGQTSFAWNASDGSSYATQDAQVFISIVPVNDLPIVTNIPVSGSVNTPILLSTLLFTQHYTDVENSALATVRIVALPANGSLYLNGAIVQRYQEIGSTSLDSISFQPAENWSGTTSFTWNASDGQAYAQNAATVTIAVRPTNAPPTDLVLSNRIIATSAPADTVVGTLTALDANDGDTQSFALVDGTGSDDNALFAIRGNELRTATAMDATTTTRLRVRIQAIDSGGASIERVFSIIVSSEPLVTVTGQVIHADTGSAVVQAVVTARAVRDDGRVDSGGIAQDAFTDEQGLFHMVLPVGSSYQVFVRSLPVGDAADYYMSDTPATFTLQPGTSEKTLDPIRVPRAVKQIVGTVSYSTTLGVAGATIKATNNDTAAKKYATTNASGQYTITVSGGTWTVALMPPGNGDNWTSNNLPQTVSFAQAAEQAEVQQADFAVQQALYFITGRILGTDGRPLVLVPGQQELGLILWDMTNQREIIVYLKPDGSFRVPVRDGSVYRIRGWVDHRQHPDMRLPDIAPREITGNSLDIGSISLVRLQASITGRVTGRDGAGMPNVTVAAWKGQTQFSTRSDNDGFYTIRVPYGAWSVSPDVGNLATASFLYEGGAKKVVVSAQTTTAQATFIVSRAGAQVYGTVVDETGSLVDARLFVGIVRPNRTAPAIVVPVVDGAFALRVPENCATCTYRATAGENNAYSVVTDSDNPHVKTQPDGSQIVTYRVRMDMGNVVGRLRDAKTEQPVSGVRGTATLRNARNSYATAIQSDGSYQFEHVADGDYTLSYELEHAPGRVLAQDAYVPFPLQPQTLTVRNGVVVPPQRSTGLQAGSGDANVTNGTSFTVQTKTTCATTQATDSTTTTVRAYPVTVVCEFANGTIRSFPCEAQPNDTSMCYKPDVSPPPACSVVTGEAAGNNAVDSSPGSSIAQAPSTMADVGATIDAILADSGDVEKVRAYLHGERVSLASSNTSVYLARRPHKQANPRRTKLGEETERNGAVVEIQDRLRDTYMFGMLRGPDGAYIRDYPVAVMAAAGGNDGQVRTVETTDGYYLFEIAQSRENWTITASMDKDGRRYRAMATVNVAQLVKNGTVFVPDMTLVEVGAVPPAASQSFDSAVGTQMTLTATDESQDTPMLAAASEPAITVDVPSDAVSTDSGEDVRMTIETVAVPSTGVYQVIGEAYRITLSDRSSGRVLVDALDTPLVVTLPYNAAALAAAGVTATQLHAATFSDDSLAWTPLGESSVDTDAGVVRVRLERTTDVIALVVPVREPQTARAIASTGESSQLTFVLQDGSTITSTLDVPAGLTVQPGVGLAAMSVTPVAVAEVQITAPVKHGQQLAADSVLIGGFTVDLLDEQGAVIPQGQLSQPLRLTLRFENARVPAGAIINMARADAFNTALSAWEPTTLVQDAPASQATADVSTIVATSDVAGQFAVVANDHATLYVPMVMR